VEKQLGFSSLASSLYCFLNFYIKIMTSFNLWRALSSDVPSKCKKVVYVVPDFVCCSCWFLFMKCNWGYILFSWFQYGVSWGPHLVVLLVMPAMAECLLRVCLCVCVCVCFCTWHCWFCVISTYIFVHLREDRDTKCPSTNTLRKSAKT
jgi:hypothetical protein